MNVAYFIDQKKEILVTNMELIRHDFLQKIILAGGIGAVLILGMIYIFILNSTATAGFELEKIKAEKIMLEKELQYKEMQLAVPSSLYALQSNEMVQNMPRVGNNKIFVEVKEGDEELAFAH